MKRSLITFITTEGSPILRLTNEKVKVLWIAPGFAALLLAANLGPSSR